MIQKVMNEADAHCIHMHVCMCVCVLIIDTLPGRADIKKVIIDTLLVKKHIQHYIPRHGVHGGCGDRWVGM